MRPGPTRVTRPPVRAVGRDRAYRTHRRVRESCTGPADPAVEPCSSCLRGRCAPLSPLGAAVHRADCTVVQRGASPVSVGDARQALTGDRSFLRACEFRRPDTALGIPDSTDPLQR
ncbi:DUF6233 domain-containing protein [Streptomyces sp. NPDC007905]|uniref:DUF6233 domain-containing protein n=1 Tax=Streptomyces sp. NPDC007905 TaxID=3364788 RepID=UPI0036EAAFB6